LNSLIYYFNAETFLKSGDTTQALESVSIGRNKFTNDKDLINYELNIYLKQGKSDVLLNKVNEALSIDPDNSTLIYVRGNIYDKFAADKYMAAEKAQDEAEKLERKAKNEKVPANKPKLIAQSKKQSILADSLMKEMRAKAILAEADYKRKIELDPENVDGHYAMGALLNNYENSVIVNKINKTSGTDQQEYDKKIAALQKEQRAILERALKYFTDALAIVENMPEVDEDKKKDKVNLKIMVLESIKSVYKNMNNELKFMEIKKQIDEIE
jgi:tetratricopeptide (TPR) repeat protein